MTHHELNYARRIREQGYRLTPQRQIIIDTLCAFGRHASANELCTRVQAQAPTIDRATVYRTLNFFQSLQLVVTAEIDGETMYEIASLTPHHHLVCRICGQLQTLEDAPVQALAAEIHAAHGFTAEIEHLTIPGVCAACQSK